MGDSEYINDGIACSVLDASITLLCKINITLILNVNLKLR